ncbi:MAG: hypothetical protein FJZ01_06020 [Candidatus Sericytochromatia bacterium]|nr:hypothetical protein [Candidatus Tanganyikabacteria bacterium]
MPLSARKPLPPELRLIAGLKRGSTLAHGTPAVPTGWEGLDRALGGGLPGGRLTEIVAPRGGKASLLFSLAAVATAAGRNVGWLDPASALDVRGAEAAGVLLERVLWVRPASVAQAFRAADLVLGSEGFAVAVLDLVGAGRSRRGGRWRHGSGRGRPPGASFPERPANDPAGRAAQGVLLDASMWNRLARRAESCGVALVVCTDRPLAGAAAALGLDVRLAAPDWECDGARSPLTLGGAAVEVAVRHRKGSTAGFVGVFGCRSV